MNKENGGQMNTSIRPLLSDLTLSGPVFPTRMDCIFSN